MQSEGKRRRLCGCERSDSAGRDWANVDRWRYGDGCCSSPSQSGHCFRLIRQFPWEAKRFRLASVERIVAVRFLSAHQVSFRGPAMTRGIRGALSAAGARVIEDDPKGGEEGAGQHRYLVAVEARDGEDALARVRKLVRGRGAFSGFRLRPPND